MHAKEEYKLVVKPGFRVESIQKKTRAYHNNILKKVIMYFQVNASQLRLETMVAMASDKAVQLQEEIANRSHADRQHVNGELRNQAEKIVNAMQKLSLRMDELDGMYDDMQERLYEVDKSRKNNLVFYGIPQNGPDEDPDTTERLLKSVVTNKLQVCMLNIFLADYTSRV